MITIKRNFIILSALIILIVGFIISCTDLITGGKVMSISDWLNENLSNGQYL